MSYFFIFHSRLIINRESRFANLSCDVYLFCLASYLPVCLSKRISENLSNLIRTRLFIITLTQTRKAQVEYTTSKPKNYVHGLYIVRSFSRRIAKSQAVKSNWRIAKIVKLIYYSPTKNIFSLMFIWQDGIIFSWIFYPLYFKMLVGGLCSFMKGNRRK